jgi:hypothetical protein
MLAKWNCLTFPIKREDLILPNWLISVGLGIVSSLIAAVLFVTIAGLLSQAARWILTGLLGRLLGVDIEIVFRSPREAADDVSETLLKSTRVDLLTGRGSELQRETFSDFFNMLSASSACNLRVALPAIDQDSRAIDWVARREEEVKAFDPTYRKGGLLRSQIKATLNFLESFSERQNVQVRLFSSPLIGRIIITESCAYLTPYSRLAHSRNSRVIKYRRGGDMYEFLSKLFEDTWIASDLAFLEPKEEQPK